jgi:hypothetical protein
MIMELKNLTIEELEELQENCYKEIRKRKQEQKIAWDALCKSLKDYTTKFGDIDICSESYGVVYGTLRKAVASDTPGIIYIDDRDYI